MTQLLPPGPPAKPEQPTRTAVRLALKDELRSLRFNLQHGAQWLLQDVGAGIAKRVDLPAAAENFAPLGKLQHLIDGAAQHALSGLQSAQDAAASTVLADAPYRTLQFRLQPPIAYFNADDARHPSRLFADVFYWLIRHVLDGRASPETTAAATEAVSAPVTLIARQQAVDEAYWAVVARQEALLARLRAEVAASASGTLHNDDNALLCAAIFQALLAAQPVRDPSLPPWAGRALLDTDALAIRTCLLTVVIAAGLAQDAHGAPRDAADALRLAGQLVAARMPYLDVALNKPKAGEAVAAEMAFIFRHA
ncbi:MAG: hypothetical protein EOO28_18235 [Comamonadaceae bacterium]|nr:MAG: hypothetical protein EOO28_18235 [Comamonadaceae bacterium]